MGEGRYKTRQRQCIMHCLIENKDRHFTVDELIGYLAEDGEKIGKATVYRYMDKLVNDGYVRKFNPDGRDSACYQYIESPSCCKSHFHLKCDSCGQLFHLECDYLSDMETHIRADHAFEIDNSRTVLYGKCAECSKKENNK